MAFSLMAHPDTSPTGSVRLQTDFGVFRAACVAVASLNMMLQVEFLANLKVVLYYK